jgi:hypothetical protein
MTQRDTWVIASMGELCHWLDGANPSGNGMLEDAADAVEFRLVGDFEMYNEAPGWTCRVRLS